LFNRPATFLIVLFVLTVCRAGVIPAVASQDTPVSPQPTASPLKEIGHVTSRSYCLTTEQSAFSVVKALVNGEDTVNALYSRMSSVAANPDDLALRFRITKMQRALREALRSLDDASNDVRKITSATAGSSGSQTGKAGLALANALDNDIASQKDALNRLNDYAENIAFRLLTMNGDADAIRSATGFNAADSSVITRADTTTASSQMSQITAYSVGMVKDDLGKIATSDQAVTQLVMSLVGSCASSTKPSH